jgi:pimeloyl-ACP methyl ester carboxylesterase
VLGNETSGATRPIAICLHYLGGSAREWDLVARHLGAHVEVVPIDLPGFGDARETRGYTVDDMVAYVADAVRARQPQRWILVGHSMGAKVATVLASEIERGAHDLPGLAGIVTVAGSPPSPEPMDDAQREKMLGWFHGDAAASDAQAREFVASNSERLDARSAELAVTDLLRAERSAWTAWLEHGSREDCSDRVGVLRTSAIAVAGADDPKLGPDAQQRLMLPHFATAQLLIVPHAKHLLPLECAQDVAGAISLVLMNDLYHAMIASERVSTPTREASLARARPIDSGYQPKSVDRTAFETLRAVVDRVVPQAGTPRIDLAARIDEQLHAGQSDGWRFAALPPDPQAYAAALATLDAAARTRGAQSFAALEPAAQDDLLHGVAADASVDGTSDAAPPGRLNGEQLRLWFEDLRADAIKAFTLHPQTLALMGYSGVANGGDGEPKSGFARIGLGEREPWEPVAFEDTSR